MRPKKFNRICIFQTGLHVFVIQRSKSKTKDWFATNRSTTKFLASDFLKLVLKNCSNLKHDLVIETKLFLIWFGDGNWRRPEPDMCFFTWRLGRTLLPKGRCVDPEVTVDRTRTLQLRFGHYRRAIANLTTCPLQLGVNMHNASEVSSPPKRTSMSKSSWVQMAPVCGQGLVRAKFSALS